MFRNQGPAGFLLVEVVIALGVIVFGVIVILGLISVALQTNRESKAQVSAADTCSHILALRRAAPTATLANCLLPAMNQNWDVTRGANFILADGTPAASASAAAFSAIYQVGTNTATGDRAGNVDLVLSWPPQTAAGAQNHYEIFTTLSW
jgi:Tfp pilus assembly protein PilV